MESLKAKKVLVTGGCGFIGSHIVDRLVNLGSEAVVLDNLTSGKVENISHNLDKVKFIQGDIRDEDLLDKILSDIDCISHQAALRSVPKSVELPLDYNDVNVNGTLKLFLKAREKGIKKIVCASSSSVYGDRVDFPERETDFAKPISPYATTKLIVEHYSYVFSKLYDLEIINLRYFNVYGPRQSLDDEYAVVVPKFINCLLNGERPPIYGDGNQERDFTYIDNVVDINLRCFVDENIKSQVLNVASGKPVSVNELLATLKEIIGSDLEPVFCPPRSGDVRKTHADISKAKELLNWTPKTSFKE